MGRVSLINGSKHMIYSWLIDPSMLFSDSFRMNARTRFEMKKLLAASLAAMNLNLKDLGSYGGTSVLVW